ncbi:MAG: hypothetical protein IPL28_05185 [Chloroflexi bacterium]|nr:hypothetical protein [Chloroflexota bacterium]
MFRKITLIAALLTLFVLVACQPAAEEPIVITVPGWMCLQWNQSQRWPF